MSFGTSDPTITSMDNHDIAGTTANRPANMSVGMTYFNTTTGRMEVANGSTMNNITDVAANTTPGGAGGDNALIAGDGAAATGATAGGAGGAATLKGGAGGAKTTTGHAAGGAAGALAITGQNGGATASNGTEAGGAGATVTVTTGNGGSASAGTGNGGDAGNYAIVLGTGGTSAGGAAGANGQILVNTVAGLMQANFVYGEATALDESFFVACRKYRVIGIIVRPLVVGSDGSAVTAVVKKVASGTAIASGTALMTGSFDFKGTINTNQVGTLSATSSDLDIALGDAIGIDVTGVTTAARGVISVLLSPQ